MTTQTMEHLLCIFSIKIKVWNYVLGWRGKICKDILGTEKGDLINYWCNIPKHLLGF